jgi:hypothetical protein
MSISSYELDKWVLQGLKPGATNLNTLENWQGRASGIAEYVSSWGIVRFWAMSRSLKMLGGKIDIESRTVTDDEKRYFAWSVARITLCRILGQELQIREDMTTEQLSQRFENLNINQQTLITEMLLEIADTIQFWTMRLKDTLQAGNRPEP